MNRLVDDLRDEDGRGWLPYVAPLHGGAAARVLCLLRDPGPKAALETGSGFLSVENDDPTAERTGLLLERNRIPASTVLPWNAYPWYINAKPTGAQLAAGAEALRRLLDAAPAVDIVLLQGGDAAAGWRKVQRGYPEFLAERALTVLATIHPGRQALFHPDPSVRAERVRQQESTFAETARLLGA